MLVHCIVMKITGYQLRESIKRHQFVRDTALSTFTDSLKAFPDDTKEEPEAVMKRLLAAETAIAKLQVAQAIYNIQVTVTVGSEKMPLGAAVKLVGGVGRAEKLWRSAATPGKGERWGRTDERDKDLIVARPTIAPERAGELALQTSKRASQLRQAIAVGNAVDFEIDLDSALFE